MSEIDAIIDSILNFGPTDTSGNTDISSSRSTASSPAPQVPGNPGEAGKASETAITLPNKQSKEKSFPDPAPVPTQQGAHAIAFDFNAGARVSIPQGRWRVTLTDTDRGVCLYNEEVTNATVVGTKRYFIKTRIEVRSLDNEGQSFTHDYDCADREVAILLPGSTLGDAIGWFSYAIKFQEEHRCRLTVCVNQGARDLFADQYPDIRCCSFEEYEAEREKFYATYYIGLFFDDAGHDWQPSDFRLVGLHRTAAHILGVDDHEAPPRIAEWSTTERPIEKPYVVIATQASSQCKYWNNPTGWSRVIAHLHTLGYEVVCIDKSPVAGHRNHWNYIPNGARDETGDRPLTERAYWIRHAAFFIGLSSGLSWLAWAVGTPVVMISGFTHPSNEFHTPYRVFNPHVCNSCWHDIRTPFEHGNLLFCPRQQNTPRQFECTRLIMPEQVLAYCETLHRQLTTSEPG